MREEFHLILESLRNSWLQVFAFLPRFLVAAAMMIVGWLLARGLQRLAVRLLRLLRLLCRSGHLFSRRNPCPHRQRLPPPHPPQRQ